MSRVKKILLASLFVLVTATGSIYLLSNGTANGVINNVRVASPSYPAFGIDLPGEYDLHGIDVSRHQRNIDWEAVSKMKHKDITIQFAFIKASEGRTVADDYFAENWKDCKEAGILRGAYHFYRPHLTANDQAKLFFTQLTKLEKGDLAPVLDIEVYGKGDRNTLKKNLKKWLVLV
jgi:lysozyme